MKNMFILHARRVHVRILVPSWTNKNQHVVVLRYHARSFRHDQYRWRPCDELKWISNGGKKWFFCNPRICLEYLWMYLCWLLPSEFPHDFLWKLLWKHPNFFTTGLPVGYFAGIWHVTTLLPISQSGFDHQHAREVRLLLQSMGSQGWHWDWETAKCWRKAVQECHIRSVPFD